MVSNNLIRAREYRAMELELRSQAEKAHFAELKAEFLLLAERYDRLADRLETDPPLDLDGLADGMQGTA